MSKNEDIFWRIIKGLIKFLWKVCIVFLYGCLRIAELILGAFAKWLKEIIS